MIVDIHAHLWNINNTENKNAILKAIEHYKISKILLSGLIGATPNKDEVKNINNEVSQFVKAHSDCLGGYVYISPEHDNATEVLKRGIEEQEFEGVKFWISSYCDDTCVNPVVEKIIDYGVPLLIHSFHKAIGQLPNESIGKNVANLAKRYPELKIIMAHLGGNCYNGIPVIKNCKNVWVDFSGTIIRGDDLNYTIENLGPERILFGTDAPGGFLVNLGMVLEADLNENERELILYKNYLKVFDRKFKL